MKVCVINSLVDPNDRIHLDPALLQAVDIAGDDAAGDHNHVTPRPFGGNATFPMEDERWLSDGLLIRSPLSDVDLVSPPRLVRRELGELLWTLIGGAPIRAASIGP